VTDPFETVLAVDIGGTKLAFASVHGKQISQQRKLPTPRAGGGNALVKAIAEQARGSASRVIAVATTGIVQDGALTALNPQTLPIENGYPLAKNIGSATGKTPVVINDAQAAAWGEYCFGAGRGSRSFMFVTASTGVGGGLVVNGNLMTGSRGLSGHVGHMAMPGPMRSCGCGRHGCLETIASGTAIAARFAEATGEDLTSPEVFAAARAGHAIANRLIDEAAQALAVMIANVTAVIDLDVIALGGGVGLADSFIERVRAALAELPTVFRRPVEAASGGADAGILGVADYALKKISSDINI
jgi:N-acylmannosamine kinase